MRLFNFFKYRTSNKANIIVNHVPPGFADSVLSADSNFISVRDQLVLLLIAKTNMNNPRSLGLRLDRCDFPGDESKSVANLVNNGLVYFSQVNGFGHPIKYAITDSGKEFLKNQIVYDEIIVHIKQMHNPDFMLELVQAIYNKLQSEQQKSR